MMWSSLTGLLGKGDTFISQDLQSATLFGDYRVDGAVMNVGGYNEYLSRLTRRISQALSEPHAWGQQNRHPPGQAYLQVNTADLTAGWTTTSGRFCLAPPSTRWRAKTGACCCCSRWWTTSPRCLRWRCWNLSKAHHRPDRSAPAHAERGAAPDAARGHSVEVSKCIYTRLGWPARNGGLERAFIHWAQAIRRCRRFARSAKTATPFARLRYVKRDGLPAFYSPTLVRTADAVYLAETKAQQQTAHPNDAAQAQGRAGVV